MGWNATASRQTVKFFLVLLNENSRSNFFDEPFLIKRPKITLNTFDENSEENIDEETPEKMEIPLALTYEQNDVGIQCKFEVRFRVLFC